MGLYGELLPSGASPQRQPRNCSFLNAEVILTAETDNFPPLLATEGIIESGQVWVWHLLAGRSYCSYHYCSFEVGKMSQMWIGIAFRSSWPSDSETQAAWITLTQTHLYSSSTCAYCDRLFNMGFSGFPPENLLGPVVGWLQRRTGAQVCFFFCLFFVTGACP